MVSNLGLFCLATVLATFQKIGWFFPNHLVTLDGTKKKIILGKIATRRNILNSFYNQVKYHYADLHCAEYCYKHWVLLCLVLCWVLLCLVLCWVSSCWVSSCWVSSCWVSSCWVSSCWELLNLVMLCCLPLYCVPLCWVSLCQTHHAILQICDSLLSRK
jgi:hypothetical protein